MNKVTKQMINDIEQLLCGTCESFDLGEKAEELGVNELELARAMDYAEIDLCVNCGWWQYPGECTSEHAEDCEGHDEMICGDCCQDN